MCIFVYPGILSRVYHASQPMIAADRLQLPLNPELAWVTDGFEPQLIKFKLRYKIQHSQSDQLHHLFMTCQKGPEEML